MLQTYQRNQKSLAHRKMHTNSNVAPLASVEKSLSLKRKKTSTTSFHSNLSQHSNLSHHSNHSVHSVKTKQSTPLSPSKTSTQSVQLVQSDINLIPLDDKHYASVKKDPSDEQRKITNMASIHQRDSINLGKKNGSNSPTAHNDVAVNLNTADVGKQSQCQSTKSGLVETVENNGNRMGVLGLLSLNNIAESMDECSAERKCLKENGYLKVEKVCDTLQGELIKAQSIDQGKNVIIKKTDKTLHNKRISIQQGMSIVVEENIIKEAILLHHLTVDNKPTSDSIAKFIKFFESDNAYYLVMEEAGNTNLADFTKQAHQHILDKKLKLKDWKKIVKYLFWQLTVIVYWLHHDMNCCHLDLKLSNIVLKNGNFITNKKDGSVSVDPNIKVKLVDFGLSEIFKIATEDERNEEDIDEDDEYANNDFKCTKHGITDKHYLTAPRVFCEEPYDARKSDIWALGIILYQLATGLEPYKIPMISDSGFHKVKHQKLIELLTEHDRTKYANHKMVTLLCSMLNVREHRRVDCSQVLSHEWLTLYFSKYKQQIKQKSQSQSARNKKLHKKMGIFPYYDCLD